MPKNESRVVLISGGGRGIGSAIAQRLVSAGWSVSLGMRNPDRQAWMAGSEDRIHLAAYNALDADAEEAWAAAAAKRFGRIDAIVANAGVANPKDVIEASDEELQQLLDINVKAPRRLARAAWPWLASAGNGRIIVMASLSGKRVKSARSGLYSISKFAAVALAHALRHAGFDCGVRATAVCPGFVASDMSAALTDLPQDRMTDPADIARIIEMLLDLPNEASVAEFTINCQLEESF